MSKPSSHLFQGTMGDDSGASEAEETIAARAVGLDLRPHPLKNKEMSRKTQKNIKGKVASRTATKAEYKAMRSQQRLDRRRNRGVSRFWAQERARLLRGERGTRNWTLDDRIRIIKRRRPVHDGRSIQAHHTFSVAMYPHLADRGEIIFPATPHEHLYAWHGGNYRTSIPGRPMRNIMDF